jgi:hypothetical protein
MGHSNIATTIRYLHLSDADLSDAVDKAFPPSELLPHLHLGVGVEEEFDGYQVGPVRRGEHGAPSYLVAHKRCRLLVQLLGLLGRVGRDEGRDEVEPVLPVLGHRRRVMEPSRRALA